MKGIRKKKDKEMRREGLKGVVTRHVNMRICLQSNGMDIKYRVIRVVEGTRRWDEASKFNMIERLFL